MNRIRYVNLLSQIRELYDKGDIQSGLELIDKHDLDKFGKIEKFDLFYEKARGTMSINDIDTTQQILTKLRLLDIDNLVYKVKLIYLEASFETLEGNNQKAKDQLNYAIELLETDTTESVEYYHIKGEVNNRLGTIHITQGDYENAINYLLTALSSWEKLNEKNKIATTLYNLGTTYFQKGHLDQAINYLSRTQDIFTSLENYTGIAYCKMEIGGIYQYQGHLQKALNNFLDSYSLYQEYGTQTQQAWAMTDLGNIYQRLGEISKSLQYYERALPIYEKSKDKRIFGNHLLAMGTSFQMKGDYESALKLVNKAKKLYEEVGNKNYKGRAILQLGKIESEQENTKQAIEYLKQAEAIYLEENNLDFLGRTYYQLVMSQKISDNHQEVERYVKKLGNVRDKTTSKVLNQMFQIATSKILLTENRVKQLSIAFDNLNELLKEEVVDIELTTDAYLLLLDALVIELSYTKSSQILVELNHRIKEAYDLAEKQESPNLVVKLKLIESNISIIEANLIKAKSDLKYAFELSEEKGYDGLKTAAKSIRDDLIDRQQEIESILRRTDEIDELLEITGLNQFIGNLLNNQLKSISKRLDTPVYFTIIAEGGLSLYAYYFTQIDLNEQLLAGFITALTSFSKETFEGKEILDQINIGSYRIKLLKSDNYTQCYLFEGSSISAMHKLVQLENLLANSQYQHLIEKSLNRHEMIDDNNFQNHVLKIFEN